MNWTQAQVDAHNARVCKDYKVLNPAGVITEPIKFTTTVILTPTTDVAKLNKTESAYLEYLKRMEHQWVGVQCLTLKLADMCRYTPDFITIGSAGRVTAHEVKGFWRDDARVKIKVAARSFPWMNFIAAQRDKGHWKFEEIKP